jgi:hypothetical protein
MLATICNPTGSYQDEADTEGTGVISASPWVPKSPEVRSPGGGFPHMGEHLGAPKAALCLIRTGIVLRNRAFGDGITHALLPPDKRF